MTGWNACRTAVPLAAVLAGALSAGCSREMAPISIVSHDSAGVRILSWGPELYSDVINVPEESIDIVGGFETLPIGNVRCMQWVSDTTAVYADRGDELYLLNTAGRSVLEIGRPGSGPGEYRQIAWCARKADGRVGVFDPSLSRLSIIAADGTFSGTMVPSLEGLSRPPLFMSVVGGMLVGEGFPPERSRSERNPGAEWGRVPILLFSASGSPRLLDTVAITKCRPDRPGLCSPEVDANSGIITAHDSVVVVSPLDWPEVRVYSQDGELKSIFRSWKRALGFNKLLVDIDGSYWFGYEGSDLWYVLDDRPQTIGQVTFPKSFRLYDVIHGRAIGVVRDSLNVQRIGVADMTRSGS